MKFPWVFFKEKRVNYVAFHIPATMRKGEISRISVFTHSFSAKIENELLAFSLRSQKYGLSFFTSTACERAISISLLSRPVYSLNKCALNGQTSFGYLIATKYFTDLQINLMHNSVIIWVSPFVSIWGSCEILA